MAKAERQGWNTWDRFQKAGVVEDSVLFNDDAIIKDNTTPAPAASDRGSAGGNARRSQPGGASRRGFAGTKGRATPTPQQSAGGPGGPATLGFPQEIFLRWARFGPFWGLNLNWRWFGQFRLVRRPLI